MCAGLSFSTFEYSELSVITSDKPNVVVSAMVKNIGAVDAHEVAQLYVTVPGAGATTPLAIPYRSLQGFARPMLKAGSTQRVTFTLDPSQYSTVQADGTALVTDGSYSVSVSGHQPADQAGLVQSNVVCGSFEVASGVIVMAQF